MLSRKLYYLAVLLGGVTLFAWNFFRSVEFQRTIELPVKPENIVQLFLQPEKLQQWYQPFASGQSAVENITQASLKGVSRGNRSVMVIHATAMGIETEAKIENKTRRFLFQVVPVGVSPNSTHVILRYRSSGFRRLFGADSLTEEALESLNTLKSYCESTESYYGFSIKKTTVVDTAFLFSSEIIPYAMLHQKRKSIFETLFDFAGKNKVHFTGTRIFNSQRISDSLVKISAGIAVTSFIQPPAASGIKYKTMPFGKNLLEAAYAGPYKGVDSVYKALENYSKDFGLMNMAIPFEKYISPGYELADTESVQLKVYYPYF